jgi:hypothetical protein
LWFTNITGINYPTSRRDANANAGRKMNGRGIID